ncbi:unnamed protein product [Danaus chrysippus]|uniref:Geranylgeranyl transferase type-2 subunit alpha n=1 Tax=Danaus chrysippus TaxID=151541 RepID=A0A8J2QQS0_9NEOP|nr:unnamed protein product [Danaus chrysippus]
MHGRIKVRTSEEEKAKKEKERQEKLKFFKHAMQKIQSKRKEGEEDDEQLGIIEKVLLANPDIYTLWNIRRDILSNFKKIKSEEEMVKLYDSELTLTEYCLKVNPKSYCAWHQREWVLVNRSDPNWKKELDLCNTYLKIDERNFHTWDYRRFVVGQCKPPLQDEFDYTTEKLYDNFSNYSAWHYRSKMLVELYPDLEGGRPIQDSHHKHELKMVQSAAFTDPDDTSAWFYQRWLLGAVKEYLNNNIQLYINDECVNGEWESCTGYEYDDLWILKHSHKILTKSHIKVEYIMNNNGKQSIVCNEYQPLVYIGKSEISFQNQYSKPVVEELNDQLDSCRQLLALEPDNRWTLLTTTVFLHCIDPKLHHLEVIDNLQRLKKLDYQRAGYYNDLISMWSIEQQLQNDYNENIDKFHIRFGEKLTSLPHLQYYSFCQTVDLSNQELTSRILPTLIKLQHCKILDLSNNKLTSLDGFPALQLEQLILKGNEIKEEDIASFKEKHCVTKIII